MPRAKSCVSTVSLAAIVGLGYLLGCAVVPGLQAGAPPEYADLDTPQMLQMADEAFQAEDYEQASGLYGALSGRAEELTEEQQETVETRLGRSQSILSERELQLGEQNRERAGELIASAAQMVEQKKFDQAAEAIANVAALEEYLNRDQKAQLGELRTAVLRATGEVPGASAAEKKQIAREYYDAGITAYKARRYAEAQKMLDAVAAMDVGLGWLTDRKLRSVRQDVGKTLARLGAAYEAGKAAYGRQDYETAGAELGKVRDSGIDIGGGKLEECANLVAEIEKKASELELQRTEQNIKRAGELVASAAELVEQKKFAQAIEPLAGAAELQEYLSRDQKAQLGQLRLVVLRATGEVPGASAAEKKQIAREYYDAGITAYKARRYAEAQKMLDAVAAMDVGLGWLTDRKLRSVRQDVGKTLARLGAAYEAGKAAYGKGDYEAAMAELSEVRDSGIDIGGGKLEECANLVAEIEKKASELELQRTNENIKRAGELVASARGMVLDGKFEQAGKHLLAVMELDQYLSDTQRATVNTLRRAVLEATGMLPGGTDEEKSAVADEYFDGGMLAYDQGRYVDAQQMFAVATGMGTGFGWGGERKLRKAQKDIESRLATLRIWYENGKAAYEARDFEPAREELLRVAESGIQMDQETEQGLQAMLDGIDQKVAQQKLQRLQAYETRTQAMLARSAKVMDVYHEVQNRLAEAETAAAARDFSQARLILTEAQKLLVDPDVKGQAMLADSALKVEAMLASVVDLADAQMRSEAAAKKIEDLVTEAKTLLATDMLAAQRKIAEARHLSATEGVAFTASQQSVYREVLDAVAAEHGVERSMWAEQCMHFYAMSGEYEAVGEYGKGAQLLGVIEGGDASTVSTALIQDVKAKRTSLEKMAQEQTAAAQKLIASFAAARASLADKDLAAALAGYRAIVGKAEAQKLAGQAMISILETGVTFLADDVAKAIAAVRPDYQAVAERLLGRAREQMAVGLASWYLTAGNAGLAEPQLKLLAAGDSEHAGWAEDLLGGIEGMKAQADEARLLAVTEDLKNVYELAEQLQSMVAGANLEGAQYVEAKLTDARVALAARKAEVALEGGDWASASRELAAVPAERAGKGPAKKLYDGLKAKTDAMASVADDLKAAEAALLAGDLEKASGLLARVRRGDALAGPLAIQAEALAGVLEPIRVAHAQLLDIQAQGDRLLKASREAKASLERREEGWQGFIAAAKMLGEGKGEEAQASFVALLDDASKLSAAEVGVVRAITGVVAGDRREEIDEAKVALARAEGLAEAGQYAQASLAIEQLTGLAAYGWDPDLRLRAAGLTDRIRQAEEHAQALYAEAVKAHGAGDVAGLKRALAELEKDYSGTECYRNRL